MPSAPAEERSPRRKRRSPGGQLLRSRLGALLRWLLPPAIVAISRLVIRTSRFEFIDKEHEDGIVAHGGQIIFAGLHESMMLLPHHFRDRTGGLVMVSRSRDGDLIAATIERFGLCAVRGSSGPTGREALREMIEGLRLRAVSAGIIVDGPKGPALVAKPGAVVLARATGLPIVPGTWWARPVLRVHSWDRTLVPLPFSRIVFAFGAPLYVAADATDADLEAHRLELARRLCAARDRAREACGVVDMRPSPERPA
jgi:lysophospholipid acyltransferase (LPLAT)-like uncharacterized protein